MALFSGPEHRHFRLSAPGLFAYMALPRDSAEGQSQDTCASEWVRVPLSETFAALSPQSGQPSTQPLPTTAWGDDVVQATLEQLQQKLSTRGVRLEAHAMAALRALPVQQALKMLRGLDRPHIRSPTALLMWKIQQEVSASPVERADARSPTAALAHEQRPVSGDVAEHMRPGTQTCAEAAPLGRVGVVDTPIAEGQGSSPQRPEPSSDLLAACPGCGLKDAGESMDVAGSLGHPDRHSLRGHWGRHSCGASWMNVRLPETMGGGVCASSWLRPSAAAATSTLQHSEFPNPHQTATGLSTQPPFGVDLATRLRVCCTRCGETLSVQRVAPTSDPSKFVLKMWCTGCLQESCGSLLWEDPWAHVCLYSANLRRRTGS